MNQNKAQLVTGYWVRAKGLTKNDMPVQLRGRGVRIGDQLKIAVASSGSFQTIIKEAFGQSIDRSIFATAAHFQRLDQFFMKTQVKLTKPLHIVPAPAAAPPLLPC